MSDAEAKAYWSQQKSSHHRGDDTGFYEQKAAEHAAFMDPSDRAAGSVDLGCGAGELLVHLRKHVEVKAGLDLSETMLMEARKKLDGSGVELLSPDVFDYLPSSPLAVWMTTGALNQYLAVNELNRFLDMFTSNRQARSLYLFDCVDPLRHELLYQGIGYHINPPDLQGSRGRVLAKLVYRYGLRFVFAAKLLSGYFSRNPVKLRGTGMGYGYLPAFWVDAAKRRGLEIQIVSSRVYEYRFHVALRKPGA